MVRAFLRRASKVTGEPYEWRAGLPVFQNALRLGVYLGASHCVRHPSNGRARPMYSSSRGMAALGSWGDTQLLGKLGHAGGGIPPFETRAYYGMRRAITRPVHVITRQTHCTPSDSRLVTRTKAHP